MTTPMMAQWFECKEKAKDALLLFRLGDFYEAFHEDAITIAKELEITLTKRHDVPMCGAPYHSIDGYIDKLVAKGYKVAMAEQTENPKEVKGLVKREIVRVITPATTLSSGLLEDKSNNFFLSIAQIGNVYGLSILDLTTAEFRTYELESLIEVYNQVHKLKPSELLVAKKFLEDHPKFIKDLSKEISFMLSTKENYHFQGQTAYEKLSSHFHMHSLDGFGLKGKLAAISSAGALISHLKEELQLNLAHIQTIKLENLSQYMGIDKNTLSHLELIDPLYQAEKQNTLLSLLDQTKTPMGGRLLKQWIQKPLMSIEQIKFRQEAIGEFVEDTYQTKEIASSLCQVRDIERLMMKITTNFATPKDLVALKCSLENLPTIKEKLLPYKSSLIGLLQKGLIDLSSLSGNIEKTLTEAPPIRIADGNVVKMGVNSDLDEVKTISKNSKEWIANYQNTLRENTGIKTLKVGFTRVFGYYIDVSKGQSAKVPKFFIRRQTLVNSERYVSEDLKSFEHKILSSQERILALETKIFNELLLEIAKSLPEVLSVAKVLARLDVLVSLSLIAATQGYKCPVVDNSTICEITNGRHPVIEKAIGKNQFIANNTLLNPNEQLYIITGPNMAGKSTYIRQVALIVILAQMGSFIPADSAHIGIVDQVFSRIGASDNLAKGQSTFMVEMSQTANILHNATDRSLVILDEIGRGTSTYDGISIAWAVSEYLLTTHGKKAKTLFATHYWELTDLEKQIKGAVNYQVKVQEIDSGIVFLHQIVRGGTDKSYGIHVAKLAGLPPEALQTARKMLKALEKKQKLSPKKPKETESFFPLFEQAMNSKENEITYKLKAIDLNNLTPMQVMQEVAKLQEEVASSQV